MSDWPRMLYRKGEGFTLHGFQVDTRIVDDGEEEQAAAREGWKRTPAETDKPTDKGEEKRLRAELATAKAEIAKVDGDGDGKVGGSRPKLSIKTNG